MTDNSLFFYEIISKQKLTPCINNIIELIVNY